MFGGDTGAHQAERCSQVLGAGGQVAGQTPSLGCRSDQQGDEGGGEGVQVPGYAGGVLPLLDDLDEQLCSGYQDSDSRQENQVVDDASAEQERDHRVRGESQVRVLVALHSGAGAPHHQQHGHRGDALHQVLLWSVREVPSSPVS